jgi:hypothetical protein
LRSSQLLRGLSLRSRNSSICLVYVCVSVLAPYMHAQGDQKVSVYLMIEVKNTQKYFKQFQSLTIITYLELGITDGVSVSLVSSWPWRSAGKQIEPNV